MPEQIINSQQSLEAYIDHLRLQFDKHKYLRVAVKNGKQRSLTQNAALHLYCQQLADAFNDAGLDMRKVLKDDAEIPWTMEKVKSQIWGPIQEAVTGHKSSTKPERHQYGEIYEVLNRHISNKFGIYCPWPSRDSMNEN